MVSIPPGPNPRGKRPYVFVGDYYGEPIPGAIVKPGSVTCAADSAWIFAETGLRCVRYPRGVNRGWYKIEYGGLFPYQHEGAEFLLDHDYALLADEMGLGKTVQAIVAAETRSETEFVSGAGPAVLILCPAIAKRHWQREVKRWTGHDAEILDGVRPTHTPTAKYVICNYDILYGMRRRDAAGKLNLKEGLEGWESTLAACNFPIVIVDEAHNLRGQKSRRTKSIRKVATNSTCVWLLSGTPMPNHVNDIWALWDLASDGLAGWFWPWAKAYAAAAQGTYGWSADGTSRAEELGKRLSFWCLGRTKASVGLQLPEKRREAVRVDVVMGDAVTTNNVDKVQAVESALRKTAKAKRPAVVEMVKDAIEAKQKVVVFTYLREQCEAIARDVVWNNGAVFAVSGDQTPEQRDIAAQGFREATAPAVFVATIDSVGVAISLVGADLVLFSDLSYDPSKLLQAEGRAHRIGSVNRVLVRYVIAAGTIDEDIAEMVVQKLDIIALTMGGMADGGDLSGRLRKGEVLSTDTVVERLFSRLMGGSK